MILFAAAVVYIPPLQTLLGTGALPPRDVLFLLPYPLIVCGADELRRWDDAPVERRSRPSGRSSRPGRGYVTAAPER